MRSLILRLPHATRLGFNSTPVSVENFIPFARTCLSVASSDCFQAKDITIWTDVDGVYSADPRKVPDAVCLDTLSYHEVRSKEGGASWSSSFGRSA